MVNSISRSTMNRVYSLTTLAVGMIIASVLVVMLLLATAGGVNAASEPPACGENPACGYIQMHANDVMVPWVMPICGDTPSCDYIKMHSLGNYTSLEQYLNAQPSPMASDPQLVVSRTTLVYSSPDTSAYSYGGLPVNVVSPVIGISQDEAWIVIPLPLSISPDGVGWVDAAFVSASYVRSESDIAITCSASPSCDYIQAHQRQVVSVIKPTYTVALMMGQPLIAMTGN